MATYNVFDLAFPKTLFTPVLHMKVADFRDVYTAYLQMTGGDEGHALPPDMFVEKHSIILVPDS